MVCRILCVDDEPNILSALGRQLRRFEVTTALGGELGLKTLDAEGPFAVVVSDLRMPRMNGVRFLAEVKTRSPDTVRIMLTGQADLFAASAAVNEGNVFRLLLKPCPSELLGRSLDAALERYRLVNAERELLEQTLRGAVELTSEILSMVNPQAFGRAMRMRRYVQHMTSQLQLPNQWQYEVAAMLSQIGSIAVPIEILDKIHMGQPLTEREQRLYASRCQVGHDLLARIPRLEIVARMVQGQNTAPPTQTGEGRSDPPVLGSRMLRVAAAFDDLVMAGLPFAAAGAEMGLSQAHDPVLVAALRTLVDDERRMETCSVRIEELQAGMVLHADVRNRAGMLLLGKGQEITPSVVARLRGFLVGSNGVVEPLLVARRWPTALQGDEKQPVSVG